MPVSLRQEVLSKLNSQQVWDAIDRVKKKNRVTWSVDFVIHSLLEGRAGLFRFSDDGHIAWMVVERIDQGAGVWMNVWVLEGSGLDRMEECIPLIDLLARQIGAARWMFTGRKGWAHRFKPVATVYERVLT